MAAGAEGRREALPHARVMLHRPGGGVTGQARDIRIRAKEVLQAKKTINEILARHTGLTPEQLTSETERDKYMTAEEAKAYGLIDDVLQEPSEADKTKAKDKK